MVKKLPQNKGFMFVHTDWPFHKGNVACEADKASDNEAKCFSCNDVK